MKLEFQKHKYEAEAHERKVKFEMEVEERKATITLLKRQAMISQAIVLVLFL